MNVKDFERATVLARGLLTLYGYIRLTMGCRLSSRYLSLDTHQLECLYPYDRDAVIEHQPL